MTRKTTTTRLVIL